MLYTTIHVGVKSADAQNKQETSESALHLKSCCIYTTIHAGVKRVRSLIVYSKWDQLSMLYICELKQMLIIRQYRQHYSVQVSTVRNSIFILYMLTS